MDPRFAMRVDATQSSRFLSIDAEVFTEILHSFDLPAADSAEDNLRAGNTACAKRKGYDYQPLSHYRRVTLHLVPATQHDSGAWIVYETNSFGLRDVEFSLAKPEGTLRIVCLGDSVTYGAGVPFDETYEQQLERALKA
jgi:hypothetical protein